MVDYNNDDIHITVEEAQNNPNFVEDSPNKRFSRVIYKQSDKELGHGACKRVYFAFDHDTGKEVA